MSSIVPGERVGPYEIVAEVRGGGMASLFLGRRLGPEGFSRIVAIKVIHSHLSSDRAFVEMFLDEARLSSRIVHPNVVRVEELGEHDGTYFLAMEFVQGATLAALMSALHRANAVLPVEIACAIAMRTADGLHAAHEVTDDDGVSLEVIHRDVSPQNILLSDKGHVKLIDFGVARARGRRQASEAGALKGKLGYMAPEQAWGREIDRRADVYALGVVLWEMLTRRRLLTGDNEIAVLEAARAPRVTPPHDLDPSITTALSNVVMTALAIDPGERFQTANAFRRAIGNACPDAIKVEPDAIAKLLSSVLATELARERELVQSEPRMSHVPRTSSAALAPDVETVASTPSAVSERTSSGPAESATSLSSATAVNSASSSRAKSGTSLLVSAAALMALGALGSIAVEKLRAPLVTTVVRPVVRSLCDEKIAIDAPEGRPASVDLDTRNRAGGRFDLGPLRIAPSPEAIVELRVLGVGPRSIDLSTVNTGTDVRFDTILAVFRGPCDAGLTSRPPDVVGDDQPAEREFRARTTLRANGGDVLTVVVAGFGGVFGGRVDRGLVQLDVSNNLSRAPTIQSVRLVAGERRLVAIVRGGDEDGDLSSMRVRLFGEDGAALQRLGVESRVALAFDGPLDDPSYSGSASSDVGEEVPLESARSAEVVLVDRPGNESASLRVPVERVAIVGPNERCDDRRLCAPNLACDVGRCRATTDQVAACRDASPVEFVRGDDGVLRASFSGRVMPGRGLFDGACFRAATQAREQIVRLVIPQGRWRLVASTDEGATGAVTRPDPDTILYFRRSCLDSSRASAPVEWCNDDVAFRRIQRSTVEIPEITGGELFGFVEIWGSSLADGHGSRYTLSLELRPVTADAPRARDARCPAEMPADDALCAFERLACTYPASGVARRCACIHTLANPELFTWHCER
jgi:serine/threonine protein kinase